MLPLKVSTGIIAASFGLLTLLSSTSHAAQIRLIFPLKYSPQPSQVDDVPRQVVGEGEVPEVPSADEVEKAYDWFVDNKGIVYCDHVGEGLGNGGSTRVIGGRTYEVVPPGANAELLARLRGDTLACTSGWTSMAELLSMQDLSGAKIEHFDVSSVTNMEKMFLGAQNLTADLRGWNTEQVQTLSGLFFEAKQFNVNLSGWDVRNVSNIRNLAMASSGFTGKFNDWKLDSATIGDWMFSNVSNFNLEANNWSLPMMSDMNNFLRVSVNSTVTAKNWDAPMLNNLSYFASQSQNLNGNMSGWKMSDSVNLESAFSSAKGLSANFDNWDLARYPTENATKASFQYAFQLAENVTASFNNWKLPEGVSIRYMFASSNGINASFANWNVTTGGSRSSADYFMQGAQNFQSDITSWKVKLIGEVYSMLSFTDFNQAIGHWDVSEATEISAMFQNNTSFNQDISSWDTSNVLDMSYMFSGASAFDQDLSGWCVDKIAEKPYGFDDQTTSWRKDGRQPVWGTC